MILFSFFLDKDEEDDVEEEEEPEEVEDDLIPEDELIDTSSYPIEKFIDVKSLKVEHRPSFSPFHNGAYINQQSIQRVSKSSEK